MATKTEDKEVSFLDMSDEDMLNASAPEPVAKEVVVEDVVTPEVDPDVQPEEEVVNGDKSTDEGQTSTETAEEGLLTEEKEKDSDTEKAGDKTESNQEQKVDESDSDKKESVDYKAFYDKLFTPFKANGKEIAVKSVDDAISLMQMGANYNKKMAALKPNLKLMKLLENNGLLSEEKLSYLIDLDKKNPDAINKLVKDSGLDPLDMGADKAGDYKPNTYTVSDHEMELDRVLDEIQVTPTYNQTLDIVSNRWDGASKQVIANTPQLLKVINSHVQTGIYDLISKEIESERMFGRLEGMSDIEAYRQVGDLLQARGAFNHLNKVETPKPVVIQPKPKTVDNDKLREKKLAASSTKPASASQVSQEYNPLALSDDAFSKLVNDKYL